MYKRNKHKHTYSKNRTLRFLATSIKTKTIAIYTATLLATSVNGQETEFPQNYFRSPLNIPLALSGTFAEVRSNHFHSGMDYRIGGKIGEPVYAVADGYVSRIKVSAYGGGKTLYITHPNGYKSVYMHLNNFCGAMASYTYNYHYRHRAFEIDIEVDEGVLPVSKGMQIGNAGNSGSSGGPHLHFELRHAHNDKTINPLLFGLPFADDIPPIIHNIRVYPADGRSLINGQNRTIMLKETHTNKKTKKKYSTYRDTIEAKGWIYTGIYATDASPNSTLKNGVYEIKLLVDDQLWFHYCPSEFLFEETRAINSMIDYEWYKKYRQAYILSRLLRGNNSQVARTYKNNGYITFSEKGCHKVEYIVRDFSGNTAKQSFVVKYTPQTIDKTPAKAETEYTIPIAYYTKNHYQTEGFAVHFDENTFYDNDLMKYSKSKTNHSNVLTDVHNLDFKRHNYPPHKTYTAKIIIPTHLRNIKDKIVAVAIDEKKITALPFNINADTVVALPKVFAGLALAIDTTAPKVSAINFKNGAKLKVIYPRVKISDNLSGVAQYNCYINGQWALAEYDGKTASLSIDISQTAQPGTNELEVVITDGVGNSTRKQWTFVSQ